MDSKKTKMIDLDSIRGKLRASQGKEYWKSLEEVADTPEFQAWVEDEFPNRRSLAEVERRDFLKFMGASMLLAGLGGCRSIFLPSEKVIPYVKQPEDMVMGKPLYFSTAYTFNGNAMGLIVETHEGRPTKVEGNPTHPASLGSTSIFAQAALLDLYDPDRMSGVAEQGTAVSWADMLKSVRDKFDVLASKNGEGLYIMTEPVHSPALASQLSTIAAKFPAAKFATYDANGANGASEGAKIAFGQDASVVYRLEESKVVVAFDADMFATMPDAVRMSRDFMSGRQVTGTDASKMNRLYAVESSPTLTGAMADHKLTVSPREVENFVRQLGARLGVQVLDASTSPSVPETWVAAISADIQKNAGAATVIPGQFATPAVHAICNAINAKFAGETVEVYSSNELCPNAMPLQGFIADLVAGKATTLIILGGNPAFTMPAEYNFAKILKAVPNSMHHTQWENETSKLCTWVTGASHPFESWGDAMAVDGTVSIVQPMVSPLHDTKTSLELLSDLVSNPMSAYDIVRNVYKSTETAGFEQSWSEWLNTGVVRTGTKITPTLSESLNIGPAPTSNGITLMFRPDPTIWDGRFANNGWLQELPKPLTTVTWDNACHMSPQMAEKLGVRDESMVEVTTKAGSAKLPVLVMIGHPNDSITVHYGYGRKECGNVGKETGTDVYPLRTSETMFVADNVQVEKIGGTGVLAFTQMHHSMEGRDIVKMATVDEFSKDPELKTEGDEIAEKKESMYPENQEIFPFDGPQWGMSIDLNLCTGCHACVVACVAENNIPVVGKAQVKNGREMHWLRIDRYYRVKGHDESDKGIMTKNVEITNAKDIVDPEESNRDILNPNNLLTIFAPVACMHCEKAPCEPVCPVGATLHSHEGLNQMIYNRCVGTRYCSNNCPYKVRRFNFLNYTDNQDQYMHTVEVLKGKVSTEKTNGRNLLKMISNPNVTVRGRGVMEKCTYCTQRISEARITAKKEGREVKDGEIITACQQACPTKAITFGNIADQASAAAKKRGDKRTYSMLPELNTKNRTTYMARLRNPNKELES